MDLHIMLYFIFLTELLQLVLVRRDVVCSELIRIVVDFKLLIISN